MNLRNIVSVLAVSGAAALLVGCSHAPPPELVDARQTYLRVSRSPAQTIVPAEVHKAKEALVIAEQQFVDEPTSQKTRDMAYVAQRKALQAEALGTKELEKQKRLDAERMFGMTQAEILQSQKQQIVGTQAQLTEAQRQMQDTASKLNAEAIARQNAERTAAEKDEALRRAQLDLMKLAEVKEESRGMVVTLSGSVLFASNQATLLPAAQNRLREVANALLSTKERKIIIEGHTDSRGDDSHNVQLSQARAEAVRSFIVQAGYDPDLIVAQGVGEARPIANNGSAEGRANNRRVELIIQNKTGKGD